VSITFWAVDWVGEAEATSGAVKARAKASAKILVMSENSLKKRERNAALHQDIDLMVSGLNHIVFNITYVFGA
jgi:hypothetical protein